MLLKVQVCIKLPSREWRSERPPTINGEIIPRPAPRFVRPLFIFERYDLLCLEPSTRFVAKKCSVLILIEILIDMQSIDE